MCHGLANAEKVPGVDVQGGKSSVDWEEIM